MRLTRDYLRLALVLIFAVATSSCALTEQERLARCPEHLEEGPTAYDSCKPGYVPQYYSNKDDDFRAPASIERR